MALDEPATAEVGQEFVEGFKGRKPTIGLAASRAMKWTLLKASEEFGVSRETIRRGLRDIGIDVKKGATYETRQIVEALYGDDKKERTRESRARADLLEREKAELDKVLVRLDAVQQMILEAFLPVRQRLLSLPTEMDSRCNPSDPMLARKSLQQWVDTALAAITSELPKGKK